MHFLLADSFDAWREQARQLWNAAIPPFEVSWDSAERTSLFAESLPILSAQHPLSVPAEFIKLATVIACHRDTEKWNLLYTLLWRLAREKHLLRITTDPLIAKLHQMEKAIRRDAHKMKAFVRFRLVLEEEREHYIAWHRPDHKIVRLIAPFFARRFETMDWTIITPDESVHWDGEVLHYGPGAPASAAPDADVLEDMWRSYYRATFNPARIKLKTMKREMPVRHWATLPEADIIEEMLMEAPERVEKMLAHTQNVKRSAEEFLPPARDLPHLHKAALACQGCELFQHATQTVFGEGNAKARLVLVGEQPGDTEDRTGHAFTGPAGALLDEALRAANLSRSDIYITNAVKHFRFTQTGKRRLHRSPGREHVHACKPWLTAEIATIQPRVILCLGNVAARAVISPGFAVKQHHGQWHGDSPAMAGTFHPAAVLRAFDADAQLFKEQMFEDIARAAHKAAA